ncbi:MATE family efflux transporter [Methanobrevibacter sp.]|uniref:MATE family efflux transporter n=1 Tax=Methanobrevibacter sp. TaxID=66852 RepID=UPI0025F7E705|nr:MATE family efflux transporter [Methanobrevibacter sp.]MBQ2962946.1 MATE family efflux transporter [Methanobrevibacter sp.]
MFEERNDNIEMITGDPKRAIRKLSVPMILSMFLITLYNLADSIWVAGLGPDALAAIGFIAPMYMILVGLGNGIGAGANSLIARHIGAENYKQANNAGLHGIFLSIVVSVIFTIIILIAITPILKLMGAGNSIEYAEDYAYIVFGFLFVFVFSSVLSAIFRSEGDMRRATIAIAITSIINIIIDPIFIYYFGLGIAGAAWATVISGAISVIVMSYWIWGKKDLFLDLNPKGFKFDSKILIDIFQVAIPSTLENVIFSAFTILINSMLVIAAGTTAVAVYTASIRITQVAILPLIGIGTAVITVAGVAYGARNPENLKIGHSYSIKLGLAISIILGAIMVIFSNQFATIFSYTSASASLSGEIATALSVLSFFVIAVPHGMMSSMVFQGVGKGTNSLIITLFRSLIFECVFAYLFCFTFGWGLVGIYAGVVFGCFLGGTVGYVWAKWFIKKFKEECENEYETVDS